MSYQDPPSPRTVVRGILGVAAVVVAVFLVVAFLATGRVQWELVALGLALWGAFGFFTSLFDVLVAPLGRFLGGALTGESMPATGLSIEAEVAALERLLAADPPPPRHRALMAGIRDGRLIPRASFFQQKNVRAAIAQGDPQWLTQHEEVLVFQVRGGRSTPSESR